MRTVNLEQVEKLMHSLPEPQPAPLTGLRAEELCRIRDGVMYRLMAEVGLRAPEAIELNIGDVRSNDIGTFDVTIRNRRIYKERGQRVVSIVNPAVAEALDNYLVHVRTAFGEVTADAPLFPPVRDGKRMKYASLLTRFQHHCESVGVPECRIHDLRKLCVARIGGMRSLVALRISHEHDATTGARGYKAAASEEATKAVQQDGRP